MFENIREALGVLKPTSKTGPSYKVIEVGAIRPKASDSPELMASVQSLGSHPGFVHLTEKLEASRNMLKAKLEGERHASLDEVSFLQAGIFWSSWLRGEIGKATLRPVAIELDPYEEELRAFKELDSMIERVGGE